MPYIEFSFETAVTSNVERGGNDIEQKGDNDSAIDFLNSIQGSGVLFPCVAITENSTYLPLALVKGAMNYFNAGVVARE